MDMDILQNIDIKKYDIIVAGCGLSGIVIAEQFSLQLNTKILLFGAMSQCCSSNISDLIGYSDVAFFLFRRSSSKPIARSPSK